MVVFLGTRTDRDLSRSGNQELRCGCARLGSRKMLIVGLSAGHAPASRLNAIRIARSDGSFNLKTVKC